MSRPSALLESHPALGYLGSGLSLLLSWFTWFVEHSDDFAKIFAFAAGLFGMVAGYYTMRIQRRAWHRKNRDNG